MGGTGLVGVGVHVQLKPQVHETAEGGLPWLRSSKLKGRQRREKDGA